MTQRSHRTLWENFLQHIRQNVTEQVFKTWFEPIGFVSYDERERTLLVEVPSMYVYEYLEQNYVKLMAWSLNQSFGESIRLTYRLVVDKQNGKRVDWEGERPADIEGPKETSRGNKTPTVLDTAKPQDIDPQLDPKKTFDNFIEGDSNKLPRTVGLTIAGQPGKTTFNPFFVY